MLHTASPRCRLPGRSDRPGNHGRLACFLALLLLPALGACEETEMEEVEGGSGTGRVALCDRLDDDCGWVEYRTGRSAAEDCAYEVLLWHYCDQVRCANGQWYCNWGAGAGERCVMREDCRFNPVSCGDMGCTPAGAVGPP